MVSATLNSPCAMTVSPSNSFYKKPECSVINLSDALPVQTFDIKLVFYGGVMPMKYFIVFYAFKLAMSMLWHLRYKVFP